MSYRIPNSNSSVVQTDDYPSLSIMQEDQWICWGYRNGRKPPIDPQSNKRISIIDDSNHLSFQTARSKCQSNPSIDGIGFVITSGDSIVGIDLDDCLSNNQLKSGARRIVDQIDSYTELSPSGNGIHILLEGDLSGLDTPSNIEIYDQKRYFTLTGDHLPGTPDCIHNRQGNLFSLIDSRTQSLSTQTTNSTPTNSSQQNNSPSADTDLLSDGNDALREFERESTTAYNQLMQLLKGNPSPLTQYNHNKVDRSASEFICLSRLYCTNRWALESDDDRCLKIAKHTLTHYCNRNPDTGNNQSRKWTDRGSNYRELMSKYVRNSSQQAKFFKALHKTPDVHERSEFSSVTKAAVKFSVHLL